MTKFTHRIVANDCTDWLFYATIVTKNIYKWEYLTFYFFYLRVIIYN